MRRPFYRCLPSAQAGSDLVFLQILLLSPVNDLVQGLVGMRIKPRPNVELFTRPPNLANLVERPKIVSETNVDLHMRRTKLVN